MNADFKYFSDLKCLQLKNTSFDWVEDAVSASITFPSILNLKELLYQSLPEQTRAYMYGIRQSNANFGVVATWKRLTTVPYGSQSIQASAAKLWTLPVHTLAFILQQPMLLLSLSLSLVFKFRYLSSYRFSNIYRVNANNWLEHCLVQQDGLWHFNKWRAEKFSDLEN